MAGLSKAKIQLARPGSAKEPQARIVSNRVYMFVVYKGILSRDGYFLKVYSFYWVLTVYALMFFKVFPKAFKCAIQLQPFYLLLWNKLLILKMLCETLLRIPFSVIGRCSSAVTDGFRYCFTGSHSTFLNAFSGSKSPLSGLWRGFLQAILNKQVP